MFKQVGLVALLTVEKKRVGYSNETEHKYRLWREKVIEFAMGKLKPFELRIFLAGLRGDEREQRRTLNRMGELMKFEREQKAQETIKTLLKEWQR